MNPLFADLYPDGFSSTIKTRLSNSYLIGEIFGMLFFGYLIDSMGRRTGVVFATVFLVLGIVIATAAHGNSQLGMFWMMIVGRGIAGFGAGGEYSVCGSASAEASDENEYVRRRRGILVAMSTNFAIDLGFVVAGVVALIVLAAYGEQESVGVWRVCFGLGFVIPAALLFFRLRLINSTQYRKHAIKRSYPYWLIIKRYWRPMLGTAGAWVSFQRGSPDLCTSHANVPSQFFYDWGKDDPVPPRLTAVLASSQADVRSDCTDLLEDVDPRSLIRDAR